MSLEMFGAIYIGTYETSLKVFEFNAQKQIREVDHIRSRMDLGSAILEEGKIDYEQIDELCEVLSEFVHIMQGYGIKHYEAYATPIFRDAENELFVRNQIMLSSGVSVSIMTNSQNRFFSYRTIAGRRQFEDMIKTSAAVVDVGGTGVQIMLFLNGEITTTQDMNVGSVYIQSLWTQGHTKQYYEDQTEAYIASELSVFEHLYLDKKVDYLVFISDYCRDLVKKFMKSPQDESLVDAKAFVKYIEKLLHKDVEGISEELALTDEEDELILPSLILFRQLTDLLQPHDIWVPRLDIKDGVAQNYGQSHKLIKKTHDFDRDVISAAHQLAKHYHSENPFREELAVEIFDTIRKMHGLGKRERLLLRVASVLQDCGQYISIADCANCTCNIIRSTEIIGISAEEREMVAETIYYNSRPLDPYEEVSGQIDEEHYLIAAKLAAILRVANSLDQSHRQKFTDMRISAKGRELIFTVEAIEDISLEQELFEDKNEFFETVFSMKPVLRKKRVYNVESRG